MTPDPWPVTVPRSRITAGGSGRRFAGQVDRDGKNDATQVAILTPRFSHQRVLRLDQYALERGLVEIF
jgi:hypothetical protein